MGSATGTGAASGAASGAATGTAILPGWGTLIGGVVGGAVGGIGGAGVDQANARKENAINEYMSQLAALDMPRYEDLKLLFQRYDKGEQLTVEELASLQELDSEVSKITQDKQAKQTQLDALAAMKARARGGLTLQDKVELQEASREIDRQNSGVQKSIVQNMAARGQGGSGVELAARLQAGQQGAELASQNSMATAARAQSAAMQSLKDSANLGRQIGQDQMDFDKMRAQSVDDTRRRNLERLQATMQYNIGNRNAAAGANWDRANSVNDKNVNLSNNEQVQNKQILMNDYNNQVQKLENKYTGKYGAISQADDGIEKAQNTAAGYAGMMNAVGGLAGGMSGGGQTPTAALFVNKAETKGPASVTGKTADPYDTQAMNQMDPYERQAYKTKYGIK